MDDSIDPNNPPSSPWATRYPINKFTFKSENTRHSYFAPEYPRIDDPKYYDQEPDPVIILHPHNDEEKDKVLWSEMVQRTEFWGMRTWELAALNRHLRFSRRTGFISGGHRLADGKKTEFPGFLVPPRTSSLSGRRTMPAILSANEERDYSVFEKERIRVNESEWLPFLRKDRWFDWIHMDPGASKSSGDIGPEPKTWSVDDPKVWEVLSVSLELVDRIFKALLSDQNQGGFIPASSVMLYEAPLFNNMQQFTRAVIQPQFHAYNSQLQTIIYGRWEYWDKFIDIFGEPPEQDSSVLLDYDTELKICEKRGYTSCEWSQTVDKSVGESRNRLNYLLSRLVWSFLDSGSTNGVTFNDPKTDSKNPEYTSMITLSINKFETIFDPDLTLGERCTLQFDFVIIMVHELMHAILATRYKDDDYEGNCLQKERSGMYTTEPFLNAEGIAEAGHYMENVFFGGIFVVEPESLGTPERPHPPPLLKIFRNWPYANYTGKPAAPNSDFKKDGYINVSYHVPSTWISKILSESFWRDRRFPRKSENHFHRNPIFVLENQKIGGYSDRRINGEVLAADLTTLKYRYDEDEVAIDDWSTRLHTWDDAREIWYDKALAEWQASPWGEGEQREAISSFYQAFLAKDIIRSAKVANWFIRHIVWNEDAETYVNSLPRKDFISHDWVWHCIGLLMMASIPIRRITISRHGPGSLYMTEHAPSKQAASKGHVKTVHVARQEGPGNPVFTRPNVFYNKFRLPDRGYNDFDQFDYLQLVDDIIRAAGIGGAELHVNMLNAIIVARNAIHDERNRLWDDYQAGHAGRWSSDWFLEFPVYSQILCEYKDGAWVEKE